ncbi:urease accessory protein UreD [Acidithiobacillus sp. AMEEHan]|uniref:urease accessory protein UreD n=1 Tax=Acidithiobacillus sp. AMEEHan TaxID=2994951 RepID=UPI0027E56BA9|nr:urease accessory protein UreD [Acidithiobacillus sp. AMEEHan]
MNTTAEWRERWEGNLSLRFDCLGPSTRLVEKRVSMPLAFQKVLYPEGPGVCHGVILHPPGGFAKGDQLGMEFHLGPQSAVLLTTPGAGKFYGSSRQAAQFVRARVEQGAHLEWVPQENILFDGANMQSSMRVDLSPQATWMGWDIWRFGRSGAGERFLRGQWRASTEIWRDGVPLWIDRRQITGGATLLQSRFGLSGHPVLASLAWIGEAISEELLHLCRSVGVGLRGAACWAVGRVARGQGLVARYLGPSTAEAKAVFTELWRILRQQLRQRPLCLPRVWNT